MNTKYIMVKVEDLPPILDVEIVNGEIMSIGIDGYKIQKASEYSKNLTVLMPEPPKMLIVYQVTGDLGYVSKLFTEEHEANVHLHEVETQHPTISFVIGNFQVREDEL